mmetsp:Transcript_27683/g.42635  ORF Transcript_27683/g.42635 Transcript_27683/m.42635 type:complete len:200 (+) Transcript_27683:185-784(+)|eukprot:CAMPEP_0117024026 /NCGR_PEP_ID=MMETSP0472-20121206/17880_1 /TAXON_ID=693140 ORGANISM="Tiarina fusus, Strain LIS" /NCGR_SAMPLE_ID=MMETSP0472 /ASSEMBLY_ACC=CAM_ASM_000603 /LENGTH=199 /DNA_ID=CAMNT_0004730331 /DNA_START=178 /DNA_END=777 /DNA_ORIENTATION=+
MTSDTFTHKFGELDIDGSESLPQLAPVSDCSAASSEYSGHQPIVESGVEISIPTVLKAFPGLEVDDSSCCHEDCGRRVTFGSLEIRSYPVILGDHPECAMGPPLALGWEPFKRSEVSIDDYEASRCERRHRNELTIPWMERKKLLRRTSNATDEEIRAAMCDVHNTRKLRARTLSMIPFECIEFPLESLKRKMKRRFSS